MLKPLPIIGQLIILAAFALLLGYFSARPSYEHMDPGKALIKLSFSHAAKPIRECRRLTQEELAQLAPNMRRPMDCPRERSPVFVEVILDDKVIFSDLLPPSGLAGDGAATVYRRFEVDPGQYRLSARLRDNPQEEGFDFQKSMVINLVPQQNFVIDFKAVRGGFEFM